MDDKEYLDRLYDAFIKVMREQMKVFNEIIDRFDSAKVRTEVVDMLRKTFNEAEE